MTKTPDPLGDRCKAFEQAAETTLMAGLPVLARLDGRAFHTFTRGMAWPDPRLIACFHQTVQDLLDDMHATVAYHQSDEITLVWAPRQELPFGGRVQKLTSVLAGLASVSFGLTVRRVFGHELANLLPHFDCRVWQVPNSAEALQVLQWREDDAVKNSVSALASQHFSHKALHGKSSHDRLVMLEQAGVRWDELADHVKRGSYWRRMQVTRVMTDVELAAIPAKHRPPADQLITRSVVQQLTVPPLRRVSDPIALLFGDMNEQDREVLRPS